MLGMLLVALGGCSREDTIVTSFGDAELERRALVALDNADIWYRQVSPGRFEFRVRDVPAVEQIMGDVAQQIRPVERSVSYGPEKEALMLDLLNNSGIPYQLVEFQGIRWFVWNDEHAAAFHRLEQSADEKMSALPLERRP